MASALYLSDDLINAIRLPDDRFAQGEYHLPLSLLCGMKAEPLVDLHTGGVTGHEFLSLLPAGVCSETYFREQSAVALAELFLLQLVLSDGLVTGLRFFNLPVRVLVSPYLCEVLCSRALKGVVIEIQDPEILPALSHVQLLHLRRNLNRFRLSGAAVYADDVTPGLLPLLTRISLPLSGLKISRHEFRTRCCDTRFLQGLSRVRLTGTEFCSVAEGIETPAQSLLAALAGFTHGQGGLWPAKIWPFLRPGECLYPDRRTGENNDAGRADNIPE